MTDREIMEQALQALNGVEVEATKELLKTRIKQIKNQEEWYSLPKEARDKIRMANTGNRNTWKPELDPKYQKAKQLREQGLMVKDACKQAGISTEQWYRRQSIEKYGKARPGGKRKD